MWSDLWPFLLTAGLTLAIASFVQLHVVPRVETRKRREDRWERDLLALGELLTFEQPRAADSLFQALSVRCALWEWRRDIEVDKERVTQLKAENDERVIEYGDAYRRMDARIDWLSDRAITIDKYADGMRPFVRSMLKYRLAAHKAMVLGVASHRDSMKAEVDALREDERLAVRTMVMAIKGLIGHPPPRTPVRKRAHQRLKYWAAPLLRRWVAQKVKRESKAASE